MDQDLLRQAQVLCRKIGNSLCEILDLSKQIGEALDRNDQITVQLLLHMRADAIVTAKEADQALRKFLASIPDGENRQALLELLNHGAAHGDTEQALARQAAHNASQLQKVLELDRRVSLRVARDKSVYHNNKIIDPAATGR